MSLRPLRSVALVGVLCLVPLACGGDDDDEEGTAATSEATTEATTDATTDATDDGEGQPSDTLGNRGDDDDGDVEAWCAQYDELEGLDFNIADQGSAADVETNLNALADGLDELEETSPSEVRDDVERLRGFFDQLREAAEENDYDLAPLATDAELEEVFTSGNFEESGTAIDTFHEANCPA